MTFKSIYSFSLILTSNSLHIECYAKNTFYNVTMCREHQPEIFQAFHFKMKEIFLYIVHILS